MASLHGINLFLLLFITNFIWCHAASPTTVPPSLLPSTLPSTEEKLERVVAFTEGITAIAEVFESHEPVGKNLKKLLDGSRNCGLVLYEGLLLDGIENSPQVQNLQNKSKSLAYILRHSYISTDVNLDIHDYSQAIKYLKETFIQAMKSFSLKDINYFKEACSREPPLGNLRLMAHNNTLNLFVEQVIYSDYSDEVYRQYNITYHNAAKQALALYPVCNILQYGLPSAYLQNAYGNVIIETLQTIRQTFINLNAQRKNNYWKKENIIKHIKISIAEFNSSDSNYYIVQAIHQHLYRRYNSIGYNYHVTVSDAAQLGHNDTVLQCSTECRYLYNFLGKDIYVFRTLKTKNNNYSTCKFLDQFENVDSSTSCPNDKNSTESLEPLAKKIANECKGVAFSLVRERLNYKGKDGSDECNWDGEKCVYERKQGFTTKCHDGIHIVFANYPLN